ncbi:D-amino acid dehydrogenase [Variovorax dokdonensis]|uniref:D-amino acid dehydrogenase n=1 Tax=Variovorax dokdonensis TaxID=344883 RepID=A0ABT7NFK3_9BURK|nr:D-amino acid dehydrogenase [Variovorax dokdonensis]MDM0046701.1 D-amino acid dehydrogenase [Variovorax dokdonensis]
MRVIVLGAGVIGVNTAWHLLERGHDVALVDRQSDAALETSFANAGQISVSYCEPWAWPGAPLQILKWMAQSEAPLLFKPRADWRQWRWGLQFLAQCNERAFARNVRQLLALGAYSQQALHETVAATGIEYHRITRGIAHYFCDARSLDVAGQAADMMRGLGVERRVLDRDALLAVEPAFRSFAHRIVGGTYTPSDESGDARVFTQALTRLCAARGARMLFGRDIQSIEVEGGEARAVWLSAARGQSSASNDMRLQADAIVVACGSWTAPLLRPLGIDLPIYPGKGYSASLPILRPEAAPWISTIDDEMHCAFTRMGDVLRVAGTIELNGYDLSLDTPLARTRCEMLVRRVEQVLPGVCDTRTQSQGGTPNFWTGLRPATPTNIPIIGRTRVRGLWVNAGHGTLGWTHAAGSGKAIAALISGERAPIRDFAFHGMD